MYSNGVLPTFSAVWAASGSIQACSPVLATHGVTLPSAAVTSRVPMLSRDQLRELELRSDETLRHSARLRSHLN